MGLTKEVFSKEIDIYKKEVSSAAGEKNRQMELTEELFSIGDKEELTQAVRYIRDEIVNSLGRVRVEELAESLNYSARHINRIFSAAAGIGPKEYCSLIRLRSALLEMILHPDKGNSYYIENLNYSDQAHFQREFRRYMMMTPREFRDMLLQK